ncbi:plasmid partitioning protein RepB C-terminal domain-containing protein [Providencia manganoxydans]|uniref:plasmid partitioning protein RepB C-terminal domain-containing protein n=1 Tax=Providencia manganoxydans TaxID=2923283 RepID=UPI0029C0E094|nr:plasmid partitioning protein RepB C-terminal domain-containing protein [Providencia manganoxydans]MDX4945466.1 plasmid partitioning protein RepB C-terminal domain-containing protein [Providencia manganoxydans]
MIKQCFKNSFSSYPLDSLINSIVLPCNVKSSSKYKQILSSIAEIGLIEPIVIFINDNNEHKILDGHLRVEALRDLGIQFAHCLISPVEETYSYNKRVNRLTILQEQKMLQKAIESGVSIDKLCSVLGLSAEIINTRLHISDGISKEALALLAEKNIAISVFNVLRKVKPYKQTEFVSTMIAVNNFTRKFALSMLYALAPEHLVKKNNETIENTDIVKKLSRLEKEMASLQIETQNIQNEYAENNLSLIIIKSYIIKLLNTNDVIHWLYDNHVEYLDILKKVSCIDNLNDLNPTLSI